MEYYLVTEATLAERRSPQALSALAYIQRLRADEGREAVALYWPEENIYTIAAEPERYALKTVNPEDKG